MHSGLKAHKLLVLSSRAPVLGMSSINRTFAAKKTDENNAGNIKSLEELLDALQTGQIEEIRIVNINDEGPHTVNPHDFWRVYYKRSAASEEGTVKKTLKKYAGRNFDGYVNLGHLTNEGQDSKLSYSSMISRLNEICVHNGVKLTLDKKSSVGNVSFQVFKQILPTILTLSFWGSFIAIQRMRATQNYRKNCLKNLYLKETDFLNPKEAFGRDIEKKLFGLSELHSYYNGVMNTIDDLEREGTPSVIKKARGLNYALVGEKGLGKSQSMNSIVFEILKRLNGRTLANGVKVPKAGVLDMKKIVEQTMSGSGGIGEIILKMGTGLTNNKQADLIIDMADKKGLDLLCLRFEDLMENSQQAGELIKTIMDRLDIRNAGGGRKKGSLKAISVAWVDNDINLSEDNNRHRAIMERIAFRYMFETSIKDNANMFKGMVAKAYGISPSEVPSELSQFFSEMRNSTETYKVATQQTGNNGRNKQQEVKEEEKTLFFTGRAYIDLINKFVHYFPPNSSNRAESIKQLTHIWEAIRDGYECRSTDNLNFYEEVLNEIYRALQVKYKKTEFESNKVRKIVQLISQGK